MARTSRANLVIGIGTALAAASLLLPVSADVSHVASDTFQITEETVSCGSLVTPRSYQDRGDNGFVITGSVSADQFFKAFERQSACESNRHHRAKEAEVVIAGTVILGGWTLIRRRRARKVTPTTGPSHAGQLQDVL